uniref:drebrin-like protein A n=1 Tax=Monopterus albus TaxID=43700 RepID=UPI0009B441BB|nr:drebrin-like protein A [Monopterus albus]
MSTQAANLDTYSLSLLTAKEDILNPRSSTNWALFAYDGFTNKLKLADSGAGGVEELAGKFDISKPQYGLCKVGSAETSSPQIAMIIWVSQTVEDVRQTECASHIPSIKNFFKEAHVFIRAAKMEDVTEERLRAEFNKANAQAPIQWARRSSRSADNEDIVGTNYRKTNAAMEIRRINRDSFWARAEREEEERKEDERRRAAEERRQLEKERILKERREAEERDRKMNEKLQIIEEQRRKQAEEEEDMRRKEKLRWEQQQKEHEEDMRARLRRRESIEKAAEAAALVSQRSINPREFFRQLSSSSSSQSPTSPGSSRTGKLFRRYQRSLTDTAFIFSKAEESAASSPRSSPLVSPFSRAPPSPIYHATSPPRSADFRPVTSPQRPRAPVSPPRSPPRSAPLVSALPILPQTNNQIDSVVEPKTPSPTEPSAPPASPTLLVSLSPSTVKSSTSQSHPEALPSSPPNTPTQPGHATFSFEPGFPSHAPTAPLPERLQPNTEEEEQDKEEKEEEKEEEEEDKEEAEVGLKHKAEHASLEEPLEVVEWEEEAKEDGEDIDQSEDSQGPAEPDELSEQEEESAVTDAEAVCQEIKQEAVVLSANRITNGGDRQEQNGIERSLSPSDTELSSPEPAVCYNVHVMAEEDDVVEDKYQEISENGQEVLAKRQMCVRALYDYQAEDESEISFEPGDIITNVETMDKAWWRGWSKNGRQGLFPANYVETI